MISIIIPTYNEESNIKKLVHFLVKNSPADTEVIVVDGQSTDTTLAQATLAGARVFTSIKKGRAAQMNEGAANSKGDILYFVHADTFPPENFYSDIVEAVNKGYGLRRYRTRFNSRKWILKLNAFFTRFDLFMCYGGDQTLFVTRDLFRQLNGFADLGIMEEYEFVARARKHTQYKIMKGTSLISDRKYQANSWWQVQRANYRVVNMFKKGASQQEMIKVYRSMLKL